jgi:hypothetical protein
MDNKIIPTIFRISSFDANFVWKCFYREVIVVRILGMKEKLLNRYIRFMLQKMREKLLNRNIRFMLQKYVEYIR